MKLKLRNLSSITSVLLLILDMLMMWKDITQGFWHLNSYFQIILPQKQSGLKMILYL